MSTVLRDDFRNADFDQLRRRVAGEVVGRHDEGWDEARRAWNLAVEQHPEAVVAAESADDVLATVRFARANGLRVAPQGTGHGAEERDWDGVVLLRTHRMRGVEVDAGERRARVQAGALWMDVTAVAAEHGLAALAGSSPDVGVVGYTLGGGLSFLGRRYGLAANHVLAIEAVTADGRFVRVDRDNEPDLFWALRGGGGSYAVVTAIEFRLFPIDEVYAGVLFWPMERAAEILPAWRAWAAGLPDEVTSVGRLLQLPPLPAIPEPLRGRSFVLVEVIALVDGDRGAELVEPLRALDPEMDTVAVVPVTALSGLHMDPEHPVPGAGDGMLLDDVTPEAIEALLAVAGPGSGSPLLSLEVRQLGGELARPAAHHGAVGSLPGGFVLFGVGIAPNAAAAGALHDRMAQVRDALSPWDAGRIYANLSHGVRHGDIRYGEGPHRRLQRIKAQYDPDELLVANHPVRPRA